MEIFMVTVEIKNTLARLKSPELVYPINLGEVGYGEPTNLPSDWYTPEPTPSGMGILGWRLTEKGVTAWKENTLT